MKSPKKVQILAASLFMLATLVISIACSEPAQERQTPTNSRNKLSFPHPKHWARPEAHGETYAKSNPAGKSLCLSCHLPAGGAPEKAISCFNCHRMYPHDTPENKDIKEGGHKEQAKSFAGKCLNCHTDYTKHISFETGCRTCHEGTLVIGWSTKPEDQRKPNSTKSQLAPVKK